VNPQQRELRVKQDGCEEQEFQKNISSYINSTAFPHFKSDFSMSHLNWTFMAQDIPL
jgi:hypothetical protein